MSLLDRPMMLAGGLVALLALAGGGAALMLGTGGFWEARGANQLLSGHTPVTLRIGDETLSIAAERLRFSFERRAGPTSKIELLLTWPDLAAPAEDDPARATTARDGRLVFITIAPRDTELDTADRIGTIYQRFLASETTDADGGLIRRPFLAGTSYEGEELYFERGAVHPFAARCYPARKSAPILSCLQDMRVGRHLMATIRFPVAALDHWQRLRDGLESLFAEITGDTAKGG